MANFSRLIVGADILARGLLRNGKPASLKNATYDLTVGEIVPIGSEAIMRRRERKPESYFISPREMIFVLSAESFDLPNDVTGLATLRTTFTKKGLIALNVGIIDAHFSGPISTSLINFSDRPVEVRVGDKFFRVLFFEHDDVSEYAPKESEAISSTDYIRDLEYRAYGDFSRNYLDVPSNDADYFSRTFWRLLWHGLTHGWGRMAGIVLLLLGYYIVVDTDFLPFLLRQLSRFFNLDLQP